MTGWVDEAACREPGVDPEWWSDSPGLAKHICQTHCPVRAKCDRDAQGYQWSGLVIGGYLRTDGSTRSQVQPIEKTDGCPTCRPHAAPQQRARGPAELPTTTCPSCDRTVKTHLSGKPIRHKTVVQGSWVWCS